MSLAETQQIMSMLQEIMQLLNNADVKTTTITKKIGFNPSGSSSMSLRRELHVLNMYTTAIERWSGNGTLTEILNEIQTAEAAALRFYMLMMAINALSTGITPFGLAYAGAQLIGFGITLQTLGQ